MAFSQLGRDAYAVIGLKVTSSECDPDISCTARCQDVRRHLDPGNGSRACLVLSAWTRVRGSVAGERPYLVHSSWDVANVQSWMAVLIGWRRRMFLAGDVATGGGEDGGDDGE